MANTAEAVDFQAKARSSYTTADYLRLAAQKSGKSASKVALDFWKLHRSSRKIHMFEYVAWELYDERHSPEEISRFVSNSLHWSIVEDTCDRTWDALTEDKFLADQTMRMGGVNVPETVAVIDRSQRGYGDTPKLGTIEALKEFLQHAKLPLFGKVLHGICGFGTFHIEGSDAEHVYLKSVGAVTYQDFFDNMMGNTPYVLQKIVTNHPKLEEVCSATATVRLVSMIRDNDVLFPNAVIKMPGGGNIADAFWRPGNVCSNIDPKTGKILNINVKDGMEIKRLEAHPETGTDLIGQHLPYWDEVLETATRAARLFTPVRYQSLDIAITENGPVVIEINTGGGFDLPQNASGKGMLTDEVLDFFHSCGVTRI